MSDRVGDRHFLERAIRVTARAQAPLTMLERLASVVRRRVPYDAAGWVLTDPDTMLLTGVYAENVTREQHLALIEAELSGEDDVNTFAALAAGDVDAVSLSLATAGELHRSPRWRTVYAPHGYGDELRAVFRESGTVWGTVCLTRRAEEASFSRAEVRLLARLSPHVGNSIRAGLGLAAVAGGVGEGSAEAALVILTDEGAVESMTSRAQELLGPLDDERLATTIVVHQVAQQARLLAEEGHVGPPAHARARGPDGSWVVVRGARLETHPGGHGRSAVVVEPARASDVAPLVLRAHRLTAREQEVTHLLLAGRSTAEIAADLWITAETVRGHVKSIYAKLGVGSRPELAATLLREPLPLTPARGSASAPRPSPGPRAVPSGRRSP